MEATMRKQRWAVPSLLTVAMFGMVAGGASGQERAVVCRANNVVVGDLGYTGLECNCSFTVRRDGSERQWRFRSEPTVLGVKRDGPAVGKLRAGDVITAIDGYLITTSEGGRRFAMVEPGQPVELRVRRDGREMSVTISPTGMCREIVTAPPAPAAVEALPAPPKAKPVAEAVPAPAAAPEPTAAVPLPPAPPKASPSGRLGFSLTCSECSVQVWDSGEGPRWSFSAYPEVSRVEEDGPAARAGLRAGDILTHIDGIPLTTEDAGVRFGQVAPGDTVVFRYERNAQAGEAVVVAGAREWVVARPTAAPRPARPPKARRREVVVPEPETTRFSGMLGDTQVLVTGGPITVTRTETEIVIRSQDIVVRVKRAGGEPE
jgi:membrane-associated protease RseP (regulator of RpoE activity)